MRHLRFHAEQQAALAFGLGWVLLAILIAAWPSGSVSALEWPVGLGLAVGAGAHLFVASVSSYLGTALRVVCGVCGVLAVWAAIQCFEGGNSGALLSLWLGMGWAVLGVGQALAAVWDDRGADALRFELAGVATTLAGIALVIWPVESTTALRFTAAAGFALLGAAHALSAGVDRLAVRHLRRAPRRTARIGHGYLPGRA